MDWQEEASLRRVAKEPQKSATHTDDGEKRTETVSDQRTYREAEVRIMQEHYNYLHSAYTERVKALMGLQQTLADLQCDWEEGKGDTTESVVPTESSL